MSQISNYKNKTTVVSKVYECVKVGHLTKNNIQMNINLYILKQTTFSVSNSFKILSEKKSLLYNLNTKIHSIKYQCKGEQKTIKPNI